MKRTYKYEETGESRPPKKGEWFVGAKGPERARFDFENRSYPILRMRIDQSLRRRAADDGSLHAT